MSDLQQEINERFEAVLAQIRSEWSNHGYSADEIDRAIQTELAARQPGKEVVPSPKPLKVTGGKVESLGVAHGSIELGKATLSIEGFTRGESVDPK